MNKKAIEIQAPNIINKPEGYKTIFLAGSIELGRAVHWQKEVISKCENPPVVFLNPRRDDWDATWKQVKENPQFKEQVLWELAGLERADLIIMYFDPNTLSPITLLELGLHARKNKVILYCPDGFYRKGNVDILCEMYNIKQVNSFDELINTINTINE